MEKGPLPAFGAKPGWHLAAVFEAPALVAGFDDFAMMGEAVEERSCHLGVAKHTGPIGKGQIGDDDDGSALIQPAKEGLNKRLRLDARHVAFEIQQRETLANLHKCRIFDIFAPGHQPVCHLLFGDRRAPLVFEQRCERRRTTTQIPALYNDVVMPQL